jgi:hypothetical protein
MAENRIHQPDEQELKWFQLVADCWADDSLKQRLLSDPGAVLRERGIQAPAGVEVRVIADTDRLAHWVVPARPTASELSEEDLRAVAGGQCGACRCNCGSSCGGCGCRCGGRPCRVA